jgi:hypothetical protein
MVNTEAWAEVFRDILYLVPGELRAEVLALVVRNDEVERKEPVLTRASDLPEPRHWYAIMRLRSLVIQVLVRRIKNNNSPEDAAKLLFAEHPHGHGSGWLGEYLDDMPGIKVDKKRILALIGQPAPCQHLSELRERLAPPEADI